MAGTFSRICVHLRDDVDDANFVKIATSISPGKVIGVPNTPPRRTSWIPTSPSPLRNSFSVNNIPSDSEDESDPELLRLQLAQLSKEIKLRKALKKKAKQSKAVDDTSKLQVRASPSPPPPARREAPPPAPTSPQRVVLGIDRGKKASDVSLKNPWKAPNRTPEKPKSTFADRLANAARESKRKADIEDTRARKKAKSFSATAIASSLTARTIKSESESNPNPTPPEETDEWCQYTRFSLRSRVLPESVLKEEFKGKTTYSISDLYKLVRPPSYDPPEYDTLDFLVTGIVAWKSGVKPVNRESGGNFMMVTLCDLKHEVDLYLFDEAFTGTWKLQRGMVVVLLNPEIFRRKEQRKDGKGFALRMSSNKTPLGKQQVPTDTGEGGESVLEVGFAKDWGTCEASKADRSRCNAWVDTRHSKVCDYHVSGAIKRARTNRMEYAVGNRAFSPKKDKGEKRKKVKTVAADNWDGGGGAVYNPGTKAVSIDTSELDKKNKVHSTKLHLKQEGNLRAALSVFAPAKPASNHSVEEIKASAAPVVADGGESKAFDAKRLRGIGFDPRRRPNEEVPLSDKKVSPIIGPGKKISLDGVLAGMNGNRRETKEDMDSDSDSDLDIVMSDG